MAVLHRSFPGKRSMIVGYAVDNNQLHLSSFTPAVEATRTVARPAPKRF
jgi:hypothetical protein